MSATIITTILDGLTSRYELSVASHALIAEHPVRRTTRVLPGLLDKS